LLLVALGIGGSENPLGARSLRPPRGLSAGAAGLRDLLVAVGPDRASGVGHSFGGGAAMQVGGDDVGVTAKMTHGRQPGRGAAGKPVQQHHDRAAALAPLSRNGSVNLIWIWPTFRDRRDRGGR
jgi:hypothetical protein